MAVTRTILNALGLTIGRRPIPVVSVDTDGNVITSGGGTGLTDAQLRATAVPVSLAGTVPVSGPLTDTQLRASAVPVSQGRPTVGASFAALGSEGSSRDGSTISNSTSWIKHTTPSGKVDLVEEIQVFVGDVTSSVGTYFTLGAQTAASATNGFEVVKVDTDGTTVIEAPFNDCINNAQLLAACTEGKLASFGANANQVQGTKRADLLLTAGQTLQARTKAAVNGPTFRVRIRFKRFDA